MKWMKKILVEAIAILITETLMGNRAIPICRGKKKLLTARTRRMLRIKIRATRNLSRFYYLV